MVDIHLVIVEVYFAYARFIPADPTAPDPGQLRYPQASERETVADQASALSTALYSHQFLVAESGGTLVPGTDAETAPARCVPQRPRIDVGHRGVPGFVQPGTQTFRLDRLSQRHRGKGQPL